MNLFSLNLFQSAPSQKTLVDEHQRHAMNYELPGQAASGQPGATRESVRAELARAMRSGAYPVNTEAFPSAPGSERSRDEVQKEARAMRTDPRAIEMMRNLYSA